MKSIQTIQAGDKVSTRFSRDSRTVLFRGGDLVFLSSYDDHEDFVQPSVEHYDYTDTPILTIQQMEALQFTITDSPEHVAEMKAVNESRELLRQEIEAEGEF